eukprot:CAMPEP_0196570576 /NCGR_PEP_ID=MMETSP1081-20130531/720_1 /TAXON_ID=36882 /ORGANISM="Pyramimonas amylifera, Strain CCMP720" /LENGTH=64 /DNA_ID=CAMNT_0041887101 /DNA_START=332 /DNA_END=526 /DNA_ORIENTATION=+
MVEILPPPLSATGATYTRDSGKMMGLRGCTSEVLMLSALKDPRGGLAPMSSRMLAEQAPAQTTA